MIDIHDDKALASAAVSLATGGEDPGFQAMLSGPDSSREMAERALVSCIAMALSGALDGSAGAAIITATRLLHEADSRAALQLWERIADDFVCSRRWDEKVMIVVGRALAEKSTWSGWGSLLSISEGDECKQMARDALMESPPRLIGALLYAAIKKDSLDQKLVEMSKEKFGIRAIGSSVSGMSPLARKDVKAALRMSKEEEAEFEEGMAADLFGNDEEEKWKPLSILANPRENARSARSG